MHLLQQTDRSLQGWVARPRPEPEVRGKRPRVLGSQGIVMQWKKPLSALLISGVARLDTEVVHRLPECHVLRLLQERLRVQQWQIIRLLTLQSSASIDE